MRAQALGWTGARCVKWLNHIALMEKPWEGFCMDKAYRVFQTGQVPETGTVAAAIQLKSIIARPLAGERLKRGGIAVLGAAHSAAELSRSGNNGTQEHAVKASIGQ